jgi:hypothetical protein
VTWHSFHVNPRGWAGPSLLAMIICEKFGQHQPLNRQAERYAREGVPLSLSTLADQVGACTAALMPLFERLRLHVMAADRLHWRRHHGAGPGARQDRHRTFLGVCARRPAIRRECYTGRHLLLFP